MFDILSIFVTENQHEPEQKVCPHCHCVEESMFFVDFAYGSFQHVHHLREFQRICEQSPQAWTGDDERSSDSKRSERASDCRLSAEQLVYFEKEFDLMLTQGEQLPEAGTIQLDSPFTKR